MEGGASLSRPARERRCPGRPESQTNLADILERVLDKGIVIAGDIQINLLDIELLTIKLRLLIASVDRAREMGINWWESDSSLQKLDPGDNGDGRAGWSTRTASFASGSTASSGSSAWASRRRTARVDDELRRAGPRSRAPELLARAEAEAVAVPRATRSLEAAIAQARAAQRRPIGARPAAASRARAGEATAPGRGPVGLLRLPARRPASERLAGVAPATPVERVDGRRPAALVSRVPLAEFGAEPLRENLNDLAWLERVARAHEEVLERALHASTDRAAAPVHDLRERGRRARDARSASASRSPRRSQHLAGARSGA